MMAPLKPKPKYRQGLSLLFLLCLALVKRAASERSDVIQIRDELDGVDTLPESVHAKRELPSARELFWVNNKHLPAWRDFKYQQQIQRRRRRRRRKRNGLFNKPNRWNGTGFRRQNMMNMNMMGMKTMNMKKGMKPRKKMMMNLNPDNLNFQPIMTRGMMKMRPMRANSSPSSVDLSNSQTYGMELSWDKLAQRRRNMQMRAKRRFKRRQWRMKQRRNEKTQRQDIGDDYSRPDSDSSSQSIHSSDR